MRSQLAIDDLLLDRFTRWEAQQRVDEAARSTSFRGAGRVTASDRSANAEIPRAPAMQRFRVECPRIDSRGTWTGDGFEAWETEPLRVPGDWGRPILCRAIVDRPGSRSATSCGAAASTASAACACASSCDAS